MTTLLEAYAATLSEQGWSASAYTIDGPWEKEYTEKLSEFRLRATLGPRKERTEEVAAGKVSVWVMKLHASTRMQAWTALELHGPDLLALMRRADEEARAMEAAVRLGNRPTPPTL